MAKTKMPSRTTRISRHQGEEEEPPSRNRQRHDDGRRNYSRHCCEMGRIQGEKGERAVDAGSTFARISCLSAAGCTAQTRTKGSGSGSTPTSACFFSAAGTAPRTGSPNRARTLRQNFSSFRKLLAGLLWLGTSTFITSSGCDILRTLVRKRASSGAYAGASLYDSW